MKALRTRLCLLPATIAILAAPAAAQAEYLVPPDNSAVTQYTETYPTAGGHKDPEKAAGKEQTPTEVLGSRNTRRLEAEGETGRAVAEVAAETAPAPPPDSDVAVEEKPRPPAEDGARDDGGSHSGGQNGKDDAGGGTASGGDDGPSGSSGLGEVLGQATGSSSSAGMGALLPLLILAGLAWSVAFVLRRRKQPTE